MLLLAENVYTKNTGPLKHVTAVLDSFHSFQFSSYSSFTLSSPLFAANFLSGYSPLKSRFSGLNLSTMDPLSLYRPALLFSHLFGLMYYKLEKDRGRRKCRLLLTYCVTLNLFNWFFQIIAVRFKFDYLIGHKSVFLSYLHSASELSAVLGCTFGPLFILIQNKKLCDFLMQINSLAVKMTISFKPRYTFYNSFVFISLLQLLIFRLGMYLFLNENPYFQVIHTLRDYVLVTLTLNYVGLLKVILDVNALLKRVLFETFTADKALPRHSVKMVKDLRFFHYYIVDFAEGFNSIYGPIILPITMNMIVDVALIVLQIKDFEQKNIFQIGMLWLLICCILMSAVTSMAELSVREVSCVCSVFKLGQSLPKY